MDNFFASNLKHLRIQNGFTQEELANKLDKDYSTIGKWEKGIRSPIMQDVLRIADTFNISVEDLISKDMFTSPQPQFSQTQILFNKTKDILSDDDRATIEFIMKKTIDNYEKNKNNLN